MGAEGVVVSVVACSVAPVGAGVWPRGLGVGCGAPKGTGTGMGVVDTRLLSSAILRGTSFSGLAMRDACGCRRESRESRERQIQFKKRAFSPANAAGGQVAPLFLVWLSQLSCCRAT